MEEFFGIIGATVLLYIVGGFIFGYHSSRGEEARGIKIIIFIVILIIVAWSILMPEGGGRSIKYY